jgi:hypothetical protein
LAFPTPQLQRPFPRPFSRTRSFTSGRGREHGLTALPHGAWASRFWREVISLTARGVPCSIGGGGTLRPERPPIQCIPTFFSLLFSRQKVMVPHRDGKTVFRESTCLDLRCCTRGVSHVPGRRDSIPASQNTACVTQGRKVVQSNPILQGNTGARRF